MAQLSLFKDFQGEVALGKGTTLGLWKEAGNRVDVPTARLVLLQCGCFWCLQVEWILYLHVNNVPPGHHQVLDHMKMEILVESSAVATEQSLACLSLPVAFLQCGYLESHFSFPSPPPHPQLSPIKEYSAARNLLEKDTTLLQSIHGISTVPLLYVFTF